MASQTTERAGNTTANTVDQAENLAPAAARSVSGAKDTLQGAYPVASLLALGAVVAGGSMLVAAMLRNGQPSNAPGQSRQPMRLASAMSGLGPKGIETLSRIRDAAFSFAFDKAIDGVDGMFPGFRQHYERDTRSA
jgi:hypothetical protein